MICKAHFDIPTDLNIQVKHIDLTKNHTVKFIFKGDWNEDGQRHGFGHLVFSDHAKYRGRFENGLFAGLGCITYPDGSK